jgi:hypothetical protein
MPQDKDKSGAADEPKTAEFRIRPGYGQHAVRGKVATPGSTVKLDHYNPRWADKFEPLDDEGKKLKGAALALSRTVGMDELEDAIEEAGGEDACTAHLDLQESVGMQLTSGSAMEGRGVGDRYGYSGTPVSSGGSPVPLPGGHPLDHQTAAVRGAQNSTKGGSTEKQEQPTDPGGSAPQSGPLGTEPSRAGPPKRREP